MGKPGCVAGGSGVGGVEISRYGSTTLCFLFLVNSSHTRVIVFQGLDQESKLSKNFDFAWCCRWWTIGRSILIKYFTLSILDHLTRTNYSFLSQQYKGWCENLVIEREGGGIGRCGSVGFRYHATFIFNLIANQFWVQKMTWLASILCLVTNYQVFMSIER